MAVIMTACPLEEVDMPPNKELLCGYVRQSDECSEATDAQHAKYQQVPHILAPPPTSPLTVYGRPASLLYKREIQQFS